MNNKLIPIVLTLVVGIILAGSVLMPVLNDATKTTDEFTNDGFYRMKEISNGDTWMKVSGGAWTYNTDDSISYTNGAFNMTLGDDWCVRANGTARGTFVSGGAQDATVVSADDVITISGTGISSSGTTTISGYGACSTGDYILTEPSTPVYVNSETQIYATGTTEISTSGSALFHIEGNIKDGVTITAYSLYTTTAYDSIETSNVVINYAPVSGYVDLYELTSITFDVTATKTIEGTSTEFTASATYNSYVVDYKVTAELSEHMTPGQIALLGAIPVMVIIALLMAAVGVVARRNE